ncbi:uncharacterized protein SOCE26_080800 [Sorangium cellulosum]|uniref:Uncharacterized protein n=1 Tax=Sorangium cellulosum TaxID=56 RepID=A0A2L0F4S8_SORCE|nr:hypothetical protein [Sorangium cellulosum]AUX46574.1 uncharacterized protein SOCE26_080800 [Sorangium cellulosum]
MPRVDLPTRLSPEEAGALWARQAALQAEAAEVLTQLDLLACASRLGVPEQIGSAASGLMVYRDLDLGVRCRAPGAREVFTALLPVLAHPGVLEVHYREETGERSPSGRPQDQRHYLVLRYHTPAGQAWKVDISVWQSDAARGQVESARRLRDLDPELRQVILWIKDVWSRRPEYPEQVGGVDIYAAVLEHGARTPADFAAHLEARSSPHERPAP